MKILKALLSCVLILLFCGVSMAQSSSNRLSDQDIELAMKNNTFDNSHSVILIGQDLASFETTLQASDLKYHISVRNSRQVVTILSDYSMTDIENMLNQSDIVKIERIRKIN